jgi:hypothetical protein
MKIPVSEDCRRCKQKAALWVLFVDKENKDKK